MTTDASEGRAALVLVADDDPVHRLALTRVLERAGFDVIGAEDGAGAVELAELHQPDLMIVDAVMPGLSGFDAIAAIRSRGQLATTPAIVVSGLEDVESRLSAFAMGADDFITKPVNSEELIARVRAQLRIVDAWYGRVNAMISDFRTIRRRISDSRKGTTPIDAARSLMPRFPSELGCSTIVTVDHHGEREWATAPFYEEDLERLDVDEISRRHSSVVVEVNEHGQCPLCGNRTGGDVIAVEAGRWTTGRAILLVGCTNRSLTDLRVVAEEVADACSVVLAERLRDWESDLELAKWLDRVVAERAFDIAFQPVVDMRSGRVVAQEALARFDDGTAPGQVFQAATVLDCRVRLELALIETAIERAIALPDGVRLHLNVSPTTARDPELAKLVGSSRRRIVLEITEHAIFGSDSAKALRDVIPASCLLAADDVGVGYAGLSQLLEFRPDIVKIDRSVVTGVDEDPARQALVVGLVQFARATGSSLVGEGVETAEEGDTLRRLGVELGQGYYFGRPASLFEASQLAHCPQAEFRPARRTRLRHLIGT